jgi:hypothetical protein
MGLAYMLFAAAGLIGLFLSLYFMNK